MDEEFPIWNGSCVGGPLDGQDATSRFPRGFLLVDRVAEKVWIYDWAATDVTRTGTFTVRVAEGAPLESDPTAEKNRIRAAEEGEFDVIAAPWIDAPAFDANTEEVAE